MYSTLNELKSILSKYPVENVLSFSFYLVFSCLINNQRLMIIKINLLR